MAVIWHETLITPTNWKSIREDGEFTARLAEPAFGGNQSERRVRRGPELTPGAGFCQLGER